MKIKQENKICEYIRTINELKTPAKYSLYSLSAHRYMNTMYTINRVLVQLDQPTPIRGIYIYNYGGRYFSTVIYPQHFENNQHTNDDGAKIYVISDIQLKLIRKYIDHVLENRKLEK